MAEKKPTEEQTNAQPSEQTQERTKLDKRSIITIVVAILAFLAILFGVLAACGVFNKNTPEDNTVKITITIEVNGGTGNYNDITFELDENYSYTFTDEEKAAITEALKKDGYELKGLSTTPDGEGGWTVTIPKDAKSPVTLYAIWEENEPTPELAIFTHEGGAITGLTDYGKTLTTIVIPTTLDDEDITSIGNQAFRNNETLTSVTIPEGITSIGESAFYGCKGLTSIKIPDGVTLISHDAFTLCSGLTSIEIPSSLTNVGHGTFYGCPLTAIYFNGTGDDWNVYIDNSASSNGKFTTEIVYYYSVNTPTAEGNFWHYVGDVPTAWPPVTVEKAIFTHANGAITGLTDYGKTLTEITIPSELDGEQITSIYNFAFNNCTGLTEVTISEGITSIGTYVFSGCTGLNEIAIPDGVTSINYYAFNGCTNLTSIEIPVSLTSISYYVFYECTSLETVYYKGANGEAWGSINIDHHNSALTDATIYYYSEMPPTVSGNFWHNVGGVPTVWPDAIFTHENGAITGLTAYGKTLSAITIPDTIVNEEITRIGYGAFTYCTFDSITIPNGITSIGGTAFAYCENLTTVTLPNGITSIPYSLFYNCTNLESVNILGAVTSIEESAFNGCTSLTSIEIPNSVTSIGSAAFYDCDNLESVTLPDGITSIASQLFASCDSLESVIIPSDVTSIEGNAFTFCTSLETVYYKGTSAEWGLISISGGNNTPLTAATRYYYSVNTPTVSGNFWHYVGDVPTAWPPVTVEKAIFTHASGNITGLTTYGWTLTEITVPSEIDGEQITSIGDAAFAECSQLTSVEIPASVTSIGDAAFVGCTGLITLTIAEGLQSIGEYVFDGCTSLESITIPSSVTSIGSGAFVNDASNNGCASLTTVYYGGASSADWDLISISNKNTALIDATRYYYSVNPPTEAGNFWHYDEGVPTVWGSAE